MVRCNGEWRIDYKIATTDKIRYRADFTQPWIEVENGSSHVVETVYGTNPTRSYIVKIKQRWSIGKNVNGNLAPVLWTREVTYYSEPIAGKILGVTPYSGILGNDHISSFHAYPWCGLSCVSIQKENATGLVSSVPTGTSHGHPYTSFTFWGNQHINTIDPKGVAKSPWGYGTVAGSYDAAENQGNYGSPYFAIRIDSASIVGILPAAVNQPPDSYRLIIKDCEGLELVNAVFPIEPEVEEIESVSPTNSTRVAISKRELRGYGYPLDGYYLALDKRDTKRIKILLRHDNEATFQIVVADLIQGKCASIPTEVNITCFFEDECPEGTCEVSCNGHRCCYDAQGNPVKDLPN